MKFHPGPWSVAAGALLSFALAGCNPPIDEKATPATPVDDGRKANFRGGPPGAPKPDEPTPDAAKPAEPATPTPDAAKPAEPTPTPKDEPKKEEAPK